VKNERNTLNEHESSEPPLKKRVVKELEDTSTRNSVLWDVQLNPNVTEIISVQSAPFQLVFMARPAGQGKHTPISCYATEQTLIDLDSMDKVEKTDQQKRRRILEKLTKALMVHAATHVLPASLKASLLKTEWGSSVVGNLKFTI
jgi:hypothetical protein